MSTLFTANCIWQGPEDSEKIIYLSGITSENYNDLLLIDSLDSNYPANTAFYFQSTQRDILGRKIYPNSTDIIEINGVGYTINYGVDDDKNLLIVDSSTPLQNVSNLRANLIRNYATIFTSNTVSFNKILDFSAYKERAITSMVAVDDGIYLSGASGRVWYYNGDYIKGPIFQLEDSNVKLPATSMVSHKFPHESESFLYVGSDTKPRLFRSPLLTAHTGSNWESVYDAGELTSNTGGILSLTSAYDKVFIGCRNNKVLIYNREETIRLSQPTDLISESPIAITEENETLSTSLLQNEHIDSLEPLQFGVKCLESGKNQVFAGIDKKPEIFTYSEIATRNPLNTDDWANILFDEIFMRDPSPAQFYVDGNITNSRKSSKLSILKFNENTAQKTKDVMFIKGDSTNFSTLFEFSNGSDWEQVVSDLLPSQSFINVKAASTDPITTFNNFRSLDGHTFNDGDLFILKDQTSSGTNGIYNGIYVYNQDVPTGYAPAISSTSTKIGFYVEEGFVNLGNRFLLDIDDFDNSYLNFYKPSYTLELEALNLSSGKTTESTIIDGNVYLGIDGEVINNTNGYSYTGYQGVEVQDVYGSMSIEFNPSNLVLKSGHNVITKSLITTGIIKNWSFRDDTIPASPVASLDGWTIDDFCISFAAETESDFNLYGVTYNKYIAKITPTLTGNPSIFNSGLDINVDASSFIKIRAKISPSTQVLKDSFIDVSWASENGKFTNITSVELFSNDEYVDYIIKPTWKGSLNKIQITFRGLPTLSYRPSFIKIDYIQILSDENIFDLNSTLSTIRLGVEGRDIKVWLGNQKTPFVTSKNFISQDTFNDRFINGSATNVDYDKPTIKIGKINNYSGESLVGYSRLSFVTGAVYDPLSVEIRDFNLSHRLPSTGGVRLFNYHNGTLYSVTDGIYLSKFSDSMDDKQIKLFTYKSDENYWENESASFERRVVNNPDGTVEIYGVIRPLTSVSYKGILFVSGQYGSIKSG